jgi:hypothetical protein
MDFHSQLRDLASRIPKQLEHIQTEEATKHAMIMPFIAAMGYNTYDPTEVVPEYIADVGVKKGEKVDYAIMQGGKPILLIECKHHTVNLNEVHASQLHRYFHVTEARFAILTNGLLYRFHTDLEATNRMDSKAFFEFNVLNFSERDIEELRKFTKSAFDVDSILSTASEMKYTFEIKRIVAAEMQSPSDEFVKHFASQVYAGKMVQSALEQFRPIVLKAFRQYISDQITERLKPALNPPAESDDTEQEPDPDADEPEEATAEIVTTEEEMEGYRIVRAILRQDVAVERIVMRDQKTYCGIILDNNNRKPICRLWFNRSKKYMGLLDKDKKEERVLLNSLDDIYRYADRLKATVKNYDHSGSEIT